MADSDPRYHMCQKHAATRRRTNDKHHCYQGHEALRRNTPAGSLELGEVPSVAIPTKGSEFAGALVHRGPTPPTGDQQACRSCARGAASPHNRCEWAFCFF
jgi:hypothetical protein